MGERSSRNWARFVEPRRFRMADQLRTDLDQLYTKRDQLPFRVNNGSPAWASECPLLGVKQT